jgi:hypothetical protein
VFASLRFVERHELEQIRGSIAMLSPDHRVGALTRQQAQRLVDELDRTSAENARYRAIVAELRELMRLLDEDGP